MRRVALVVIALAFLVAAPTARVLSRAGGSGGAGDRPANPEEDGRSRLLDAGLADVRAREAEKGRIATLLVRGEVDLEQAVTRFEALGDGGPERFELLRRRYPKATAEELNYWLVLWSTRGVTEVPADQVAAAQARIFAAFRQRFPQGPDPAADPYLRPVGQTQMAGR